MKAMTRENPEARPDAAAALQQWRQIRGGIFLLHRGWRLRDRSENGAQTIGLDIIAFMKLGLFLSKRFLMWTVRLLYLFRRLF